MSFPKAIQQLIDALTQLPDVGPKTAAKYAFFLNNQPQSVLDKLAQQIKVIKKDTSRCPQCFRIVETLSAKSLCSICIDASRNSHTLLVIEKDTDSEPLEAAGYKGAYFVLGGLVATRTRSSFLKQRLSALSKLVSDKTFKELIIAFNPTPHGDATGNLIAQLLNDSSIKITRLGRGLPTGADLRYADKETLKGAFRGRTAL